MLYKIYNYDMKCPKCNKKMVLKSKDFSYNNKPSKKYVRRIYWCKDDDVWISLEIPEGKK